MILGWLDCQTQMCARQFMCVSSSYCFEWKPEFTCDLPCIVLKADLDFQMSLNCCRCKRWNLLDSHLLLSFENSLIYQFILRYPAFIWETVLQSADNPVCATACHMPNCLCVVCNYWVEQCACKVLNRIQGCGKKHIAFDGSAFSAEDCVSQLFVHSFYWKRENFNRMGWLSLIIRWCVCLIFTIVQNM